MILINGSICVSKVNEYSLYRNYSKILFSLTFIYINAIIEPFDLTNTARSVYDPDIFSKIIFILNITYTRLKRRYSLNDIFDEIRLMMIGSDWGLTISDEEW